METVWTAFLTPLPWKTHGKRHCHCQALTGDSLWVTLDASQRAQRQEKALSCVCSSAKQRKVSGGTVADDAKSELWPLRLMLGPPTDIAPQPLSLSHCAARQRRDRACFTYSVPKYICRHLYVIAIRPVARKAVARQTDPLSGYLRMHFSLCTFPLGAYVHVTKCFSHSRTNAAGFQRLPFASCRLTAIIHAPRSRLSDGNRILQPGTPRDWQP